jgi:hypothetical protein
MPKNRWAGRTRILLAAPFLLALLGAQFVESGDPALSARLDVSVDPAMPVRVYLTKNGREFRLSPVDALMPLRVDMFYRERLWKSSPDPRVLEVTCNDQSHFFLLKGHASFRLPAGHYRLEAYRGLFYVPAAEEFNLKAGETRAVRLHLENWLGAARGEWLSGDDHIHLTRAAEDNKLYLGWLEAEDLSVGNFLQLQRQMDAAVQYAFGAPGEARSSGYSVRSGQESRTEFYGHINLLGGRELIRPLSAGPMYANSTEPWPYPSLLFRRGRELGATVGYAHFAGSMPHSTQLMDLALGRIDFVEVFQSGELKTGPWYQLLNAGLRVTGIAGSDFPVPLNNRKPWPHWIPLLGPERTLVKAKTAGSPYEAWAAGVRAGNVVVSNGPLVEIAADERLRTGRASARFYRPLEKLEIVVNGRVAAAVAGDGRRTSLDLAFEVPPGPSCWVAARVTARREPGEPEIQAHTNPVYLLEDGKPVQVPEAREAVASAWAAELDWYKSDVLPKASQDQRRQFLADAERALAELRLRK